MISRKLRFDCKARFNMFTTNPADDLDVKGRAISCVWSDHKTLLYVDDEYNNIIPLYMKPGRLALI
jgi:hypothetical protein